MEEERNSLFALNFMSRRCVFFRLFVFFLFSKNFSFFSSSQNFSSIENKQNTNTNQVSAETSSIILNDGLYLFSNRFTKECLTTSFSLNEAKPIP